MRKNAFSLVSCCLVTLLGVGCAGSDKQEQAVAQPVAASALAYAPPMVQRFPADLSDALDARLARAGRGETALLGYDSARISTYLLDIDDRQRVIGGIGGWGGGFRGFGFGGSSIGIGRSYDDVSVRQRVLSTFDRVRPAGELN